MVKLANPQTSSNIKRHLFWAALNKIGQKELDTGKLPEATSHAVDLQITGSVDGHPVSQSIEAVVTIGERRTKSSSVNPQVPELVAWILSKLNTATRTRILADLPEEFDELGEMPESNAVLVDDAKSMLKKLRQTKTVDARGPIRCEHVLKSCLSKSRLAK